MFAISQDCPSPSIAVLSINLAIDAMGQNQTLRIAQFDDGRAERLEGPDGH
jgi:hypothetical protein